jgi:plasmid stability protein
MANLQVKGIDDDLYRALGARAKRENRSISQQVVTIIEEYLTRGGEIGRRPAAAFLDLAGSWADERDADEIAREIRKARRNRQRARQID